MQLIGFLIQFMAAITATTYGSHHHDSIKLSPSDATIVRYTNDSLILQCRTTVEDIRLQWRTPKGEIIHGHKGHIHVEKSEANDELKLVFAHITLADRGNWTCEDEAGTLHRKQFELMVYQKITFTENATTMTVKEGTDVTILCEVKGEPQPNITWSYNGQPVIVGAKYQILADGLLVNKVKQNDTGNYTCRAYQVSPMSSDVQERNVLLKIEHKPRWPSKQDPSLQYAYLNGSTTIRCRATAEPPANFTWYRHMKRLHNNSHYSIVTAPHWSLLTIRVNDAHVFDRYRCHVQNPLGSIEREISLEQGSKPPPPTVFQLRGFNSNTFDVDVGSVRGDKKLIELMDVNGFRIEYITESEFNADAGKWTNTKRKEFPFEDGATFLIGNLEPNTTYLMRAASRNVAGYSDWTKVERYHTLSNEPPSAAPRLDCCCPLLHLFVVSLIAVVLGKRVNNAGSMQNIR